MSGRVLIVDDVATNRMLLSLLLSKAYYDVDEAESGQQALEVARKTRPDVALVDVMMPGMNGYELCRAMKADPDLADIPVVMVTALGDQDDRLTALDAGADDFLTKPVRELALFARLRSLMRMKAMTDELRLRDDTMRDFFDSPPPTLILPPDGARVLSMTSEANAAMLAELIAPRLNVTIESVTTAREAFKSALERPPEALLVDSVGFADFSNTFTTALRQRPETRGAAMLTLVAEDDLKAATDSLDAGANDYLMYPLDPAELTARLRTQLRHKAYADQLRAQVSDGLRQAVTDPLTGLRNRRYLDAHLLRITKRAIDDNSPMCVMAFDLDRFKLINDEHGHAAGDAVLRQFAQRLLDNTRSVDLVARIGGEEFVVAMPEAPLDHARVAAERVRKAVEAPGFNIGDTLLNVTVSIGVAEFLGANDSAQGMLERADAALYASKSNGRNRVTLAAA